MMRWAGHVAHMGEIINVCKMLVRNPEENRLLDKPRHRWEDNIKMDLKLSEWIWTGFIWLNIRTGGRLL
jgi:hypothetical protein